MKKIGFIAMSILMTALAFASCGEKEKDYYEITVACQKEASEEGVMKALIEAYQKENPDVVINIETFSVSGYESYMNGISELEESDPDETPHIIWTSDTTLMKRLILFGRRIRPMRDGSTIIPIFVLFTKGARKPIIACTTNPCWIPHRLTVISNRPKTIRVTLEAMI